MKLDTRPFVEQLTAGEARCIGAVFCTYTFDPTYFEEEVLRVVLQLRGDPVEDAARFHEEARRALVETPVACFIDASVRKGGLRLPYDVHLVRRRTFHPKLMLVLFDEEARLAIGSGNVTRDGLEKNTEMFFVRRLEYSVPEHAAMLARVSRFLGECAALDDLPATQLTRVRECLARRIADVDLDDEAETDALFVSSFDGPLIDAIGGAIHPEAKIMRVGVLAPFFELDAPPRASADEGLDAVLAKLLALRPSRGAVLDVGVPWENVSLTAPVPARVDALEDELGSLWSWRRRDEKSAAPADEMTYFVVEAVTAKRVTGRGADGASCRYERDALDADAAKGRLWRLPRPIVHAPKRIIARIASEHDVRLWLHPTAALTGGVIPVRRPLHAKVFLVTTIRRGREFTYALVGSANASRSALGRSVAEGGNVETGVLCRFDGEVTLRDLLPSLVRYDHERVDLEEREFLAAGDDLSAWVAEVVHDAAARTLSVAFRKTGPAPLGTWALFYGDHAVAHGDGPPAEDCVIDDFVLGAACAELRFESGGAAWTIPIRVLDVTALPTTADLAALDVRELLAILGRRVGAERLASLRTQRGTSGVQSTLDAVFGEGFGPTDVFKAWWGAMDDIATASTPTVVRQRLYGPTGVLAAWSALAAVSRDVLSGDETWVYGRELVRELRGIVFPVGPDTGAKHAIVVEAIREIDEALVALAPDAGAHAWLSDVLKFYGVGGADGSA